MPPQAFRINASVEYKISEGIKAEEVLLLLETHNIDVTETVFDQVHDIYG